MIFLYSRVAEVVADVYCFAIDRALAGCGLVKLAVCLSITARED